jgi:hypothetical protein
MPEVEVWDSTFTSVASKYSVSGAPRFSNERTAKSLSMPVVPSSGLYR